MAPAFRTFVEVLRHRAAESPQLLGFRFLDDRGGDGSLTYGELDRRARIIAAHLQQRVAAGARALLLYAPGTEYVAAFFGCLYAGVIAVPAYPPNARTLPRLLAMIADCGATVGLTSADIAALIPPLEGGPSWIATDELPAELAEAWQPPPVTEQTVAFLQYTSGSTGSPKGVVLSHGNLLRNEGLIAERFEHHLGSAGVNWLPPYHDMGLIGCILQPIYLGYPTTMMSPLTFVRHPARWLQAISRFRATTAGGPNFGYEHCVAKVTPEQCAGLDLRSWDVAFVAAEPTRADTLERFARRFAPYGFRHQAFYHCYGLAESTLIVLGGQKREAPIVRHYHGDALARGRAHAADTAAPATRALVSAGRIGLGERVAIVDPETREPCAAGRVGEIWVQGESIAGGYWNRPETSLEIFGAYTAGGEGPWLRTGDLGFLEGDELFIAGRIKDLIIVDGTNHYPQDIELTVERCHTALRPGCTAAFAVGHAPERAAVVCELREGTAAHEEVFRAVTAAVATTHGLRLSEIRLLRRGSVPKTTSGKIQRRASRDALLDGTLDVIAAWSDAAAAQKPDGRA